MRVIENQNKELVEQIRESLAANDGYCPCALEKTIATKCMCKDFKEKINNGYIGECNCGLYKSEPNIVYLCGDIKYKKDFLYWLKFFSLHGMIVVMPPFVKEEELIDQYKETLKNVHIQKMMVADLIFVIDKYGKVSDTLRKDLEKARYFKKKIQYASETDID